MKLINETSDVEYLRQIQCFIDEYKKSEAIFTFQTSGSTGIKKNIIITKKQIKASAKATIKALDLQTNYTALLCLGLDFIAAKMMITRAIEANMNLIITKPTANLIAIINRNKIDFAAFAPLQIEKIITSAGIEPLNKIEKIIIGGAAISNILLEKLKNSTSNIYQTFGMTETVSHIALRKINGENASKYYTVLPNIEIKTTFDNCLCVKGEVTNHKWIETTDIIQLIDYKTFDWLGRKDFIINSGGIKINPEELEAKIQPFVAFNFIISSLADDHLGQKLILVIEKEKSISDLNLNQLTNILPKYEVPKQIYCLEKFPLTESGKINRLEIQKIINSKTF